jgi:hypothetical protein
MSKEKYFAFTGDGFELIGEFEDISEAMDHECDVNTPGMVFFTTSENHWHEIFDLFPVKTQPAKALRGKDLSDYYYLGGPMTGYPSYNFPAFDLAKKQLEARGLKIVSPADVDREELGIDPDNVEITDELLESIVRKDADLVIRCKRGIILLDGWKASKGATAEHALARWMKHQVQEYDIHNDILTNWEDTL